MAKAAPASTKPGSEPEPLVHFQREWYAIGKGLCGAAADASNVPVQLVVANPGAIMGRRLCAGCVSRFHRIGSADAVRAERQV